LVKHYGEYIDFYQANVQSTINLLELAKTTRKDFHYVSTIGVFANTCISNQDYNIFTENIIDNVHANLDNIYTKTKYEGEEAVLKYREHGVKANIYRIGNIAINSVTHKAQENIEDNAFIQCVKAILELGIIPQELREIEISPVDYTAAAIITLFNQKRLYNQIYHVFHPEKSNLYTLLHPYRNNIKQISFAEFIDDILIKLKNSHNTNRIELFMLHQGWLRPNIKNLAKVVIFQDKTNYILNQLNFQWPNITSKMLSNIIESVEVDYA
jgi:surfactin family lipopeptide synthetase A